MEQENRQPPKQLTQIFTEIADRQGTLMENIIAAAKETNLVKSYIRFNKVRKVVDKLVSFREEVMQLEMIFDQPRKYLQSYKDIEKMEKDPTVLLRLDYGVSQMLSKGQLADRRVRIFTLLEDLEREVSDKKSEIQFNRAIIVSLIAVAISLTPYFWEAVLMIFRFVFT